VTLVFLTDLFSLRHSGFPVSTFFYKLFQARHFHCLHGLRGDMRVRGTARAKFVTEGGCP